MIKSFEKLIESERHLLPRNIWPDYLQKFKELKHISVGKCLYDINTVSHAGDCFLSSDRIAGDHFAHAHNNFTPLSHLWYNQCICFAREKYLGNKNLVLHELAHILEPSNGHHKAWGDRLLAIGGSLDAFPIDKDNWVAKYEIDTNRSCNDPNYYLLVPQACALGWHNG